MKILTALVILAWTGWLLQAPDADTSGQDVALAPPDPRRKWLIRGGLGIAAIALIVLAAPWVQRWSNATVRQPIGQPRSRSG